MSCLLYIATGVTVIHIACWIPYIHSWLLVPDDWSVGGYRLHTHWVVDWIKLPQYVNINNDHVTNKHGGFSSITDNKLTYC